MSNRDGRNTSSPQTKPEGSESEEDICELEHLRKLFIGGLVPYTTEESLKSFYGQWGKVVDVVVMRDPVTKRSRGFGFITYTKSSMVDKAQENRPHVIDGKTVEAKRALPRPERETRETNISVKKLFVGGLKDNHDEECLREYFSQFGKVISIKILTDKTTGKRRGFAFIEFDDYDAVDKAILQKTHSIKYVVVDVKKSVYNQEQQSRQQNSNIPLTNNGQQSKPPPKGNEHSAYPPPQQPAMPPYQHPPPMAGPPPPNYNYWGPAPPAMPPQQYGGYQQPPPQNWNYPPAPNGWNSGPPPPPNAGHGPAPYWYPNQWGCPPPAAPPAPVAPPGIPGQSPTWNAPPSTAAPVPPPGPPNNATVPQQPPPNNFGTGYQQNYGGGPTKHMNSNRMNPYSAPPVNNYVSNGGYNGGPPKPPPVSTGAGSASANSGSGPSQGGNKFRR